jgi:anaerobic magnesium-protoporphyrin IX monomethyl ester cyclase
LKHNYLYKSLNFGLIMKILIGYPPTESEKGIATLGQNRQFQWFSNPSFFYPIVPATAATMLDKDGNDVTWLDCVAEKISWKDFIEIVNKIDPDLFVFETKTPVIKQHWKLIDKLKVMFPKIKIVLFGDHVTSFPGESMKNSNVDFVITGGNYDFVLKDLAKFLNKKTQRIPKGVYYRSDKLIMNSGKAEDKYKLDDAPFIDRELTKWRLYQDEYNISRKPYFYIMSGRDCWWGKCTFCSWPRMYPCFNFRSVESVLDEIGFLIKRYGAREIFDDSGTLMVGKWLRELCKGLIERGYNKKIKYSCNMRFGVLKQEDYELMKKAGFRLLKFGLESANQSTLDRLEKGIKISDVVEGCEMAHKAGLTTHLTMIIGYPWETKKDALRTFELAKSLMQSGNADLLQATVLMPYPGTPLWEDAVKNNWFYIDHKDYEKYDQREPVLNTADNDPKGVASVCGKTYTIFLTPKYIFRRFINMRSWDDVLLNLRGIKPAFGHLSDFKLQK